MTGFSRNETQDSGPCTVYTHVPTGLKFTNSDDLGGADESVFTRHPLGARLMVAKHAWVEAYTNGLPANYHTERLEDIPKLLELVSEITGNGSTMISKELSKSIFEVKGNE